jgi:hypothetical protein
MKLIKNKYIVQKEFIRKWLENNKNPDMIDTIGNIAMATNCPIIVVCEFVKELTGPNADLDAFQLRLMEFYGVTHVE